MHIRPEVKKVLPLGLLLVVLVVVLIAVPQAVRYRGKASGVNANITVDLEAILGPMPRPWRNLAQGGEESEPMIDDVVGEVAALRPEYIRIDHIYDLYEVVSNNGGAISYDWTRLDAVVNSILATGAKPFLALSYMPPAISQGDIIDQPKNWGDWEELVKATIEHYSGRNGMNIANVYYEVWNEPDLFGGWKTYGDKNYLNLYSYASRGASRASNVNAFKLGGPATTALYENWVDRFLDYAVNNNLRIDFYSWHRYSRDLEQYEKDAAEIDYWLERHPEKVDLELIVTEWGHDSENDAGYDSGFGAIHTMAASRVMMGRIDRAFVFEIKDGPGEQQYWGRWGIMTHEKFGTPVKKPRYNALAYLNTLGDERGSLGGEGSWVRGVAALKNGVYQVLLVNYDPKGSHVEMVPVLFDNLPSGNFVYKRTDWGGNVKTLNVATTSAQWKVEEYMSANTATMLTLEF